MEKILFPIDFTEKIDTLLPLVTTFVEKFDATLHVIFVAQDLGDFTAFHVPHGNIKQFQGEVLQSAQQKMAGVAREMLQGFAKLKTHVCLGSPADKIVEYARSEAIDLIIMGTHGRKGLERTIFGSVCDKVVRNAPCPVLTANPATL
ncbi:MAG: universal stress protein [Deltaproteobacteria bacterium]|nr:universal stress protein [Deltaproteobacteria bacterium]